jgi:hypothetical protein
VAVLPQPVAAQRVQLRDDAEHRIADALGLDLELRHVDLVDRAVAHDLVRRRLRDDPEPRLHTGESRLDVQVLLRAVLVRPDAAHRRGAEDVAEDGGVDDCRRHNAVLLVDAS